MTACAGRASAAAVLSDTPAPEDSGAETADRYEWQAMMATADLLALYFSRLDSAGSLVDTAEFTMLCEHHEDWAVIAGSETEIVSCKHREEGVGPLSTFRLILVDGGVLHLLDRWQGLGKTPLCRLVTSAALTGDGAKTSRACDRLRADQTSQDPEVVDVIRGLGEAITRVRSTKGEQSAPEPDEVLRAFLAALHFEDAQPRRNHLPDMAAERYGRPVAERLGNAAAAPAIWQAALALVRQRMRAAGPSVGGALPVVLGNAHDSPLAPRTISCTDVDFAVRFALRHSAGYAPLPRIIMANTMAIKMAHGGCSDNAIERADALRRQYGRYWSVRRGIPGLSDQKRQVTNLLRREVDLATHAVRADGIAWGATLWRMLDDRFRILESQSDAHGLNADLLLGGVSELANNCRAWYSDRFDVQEGIRQFVQREQPS